MKTPDRRFFAQPMAGIDALECAQITPFSSAPTWIDS
jgi:hypothetical protein